MCVVYKYMHVYRNFLITPVLLLIFIHHYRGGNWCGDGQRAPREDTDPIQLAETSQQFSLCPLFAAHFPHSFIITNKETSLPCQATPENKIDWRRHHRVRRWTEEGFTQHTREKKKERFEVQLSATQGAGARTWRQPSLGNNCTSNFKNCTRRSWV